MLVQFHILGPPISNPALLIHDKTKQTRSKFVSCPINVTPIATLLGALNQNEREHSPDLRAVLRPRAYYLPVREGNKPLRKIF